MEYMKRRQFLKLIGVATVAPSVLAGKEKPVKLATDYARGKVTWSTADNPNDWGSVTYCIAMEDIPKDGYGWVWVGGGRPISLRKLEKNT